MKTPPNHFKFTLLITFISLTTSFGQVGIGTTNPAEGTILDIQNDSTGILIPRVSLLNRASQDPITTTSPLTTGVLVFNNATAGAGNNAVSPGFYYWNGLEWLRILDSLPPNTNIYTNDGTLTANRTVSQGDRELTFEGTTGRNAITIRRTDNSIETGLSFRNSGSSYDASIFMESPNSQGLVIATGGNNPDPNNLEPTVIFNNNSTSSFSNELSIYEGIANQGTITSRLYGQGDNGILELNRDGAINHSLNANGESVFNTQQIDLNTRFATNNQANTLFINGGGDNVGIGTNAPLTDVGLTVTNSAYNSAIMGLLDAATTGNAIEGSTTGSGNGVFGFSENVHGIFGFSQGSSPIQVLTGVIGLNNANTGSTGIAGATITPATSGTNIGIRAVSGGSVSITPTGFNNIGIASNASDLALSALTERPIDRGIGDIESAFFRTNFSGVPDDADARDPQARLAGFEENVNIPGIGNGDTFYGAYLYSGGSDTNSSFAYAGARHDGTNYKIIGNGAVSTLVADETGTPSQHIMFAPEAPEVLFEDYGGGQLKNGKAQIKIDPIFSENIIVNDQHQLRVFIQLEGDCNGVYVTNKTAQGFTVTELENGQSNINFSWHIVANRRDFVSRESGEVSKYSDLRFPEAPLPKTTISSNTTQIAIPSQTE